MARFSLFFLFASLSPDRQDDESEPAAPSTRLPVSWSLFLAFAFVLAIGRPRRYFRPRRHHRRPCITSPASRVLSNSRTRPRFLLSSSYLISELRRRVTTYVTTVGLAGLKIFRTHHANSFVWPVAFLLVSLALPPTPPFPCTFVASRSSPFSNRMLSDRPARRPSRKHESPMQAAAPSGSRRSQSSLVGFGSGSISGLEGFMLYIDGPSYVFLPLSP